MCFPHAGGSATYYHPLAQAPQLMEGAEVLAVQYPGRQDRRKEPFVDSVPLLADHIAAALGPFTGRPLVFFGHSMGATIAYEVACRLGARQPASGPSWLIASGRRAPSRFRLGTVHRRTDAEIVEELRRVGGTDPAFLDDRELLATIIPVIRNDYRAIEGYRWTPSPPLTCPITALVGNQDPQTTRDEAAAWEQHTSGAFELREFAGGHFYLDFHRRGVADCLSQVLEHVVRPLEQLGGKGR
ncbi:thioesterase II family protein [Streptomyces sp. NPDC058268]|uniref:thioesterase II family protein n=1 Tax=Streptomyces sp. NPDC058268 TaxID=3346413 RepID=UPI0036EC3544